MAKIPTKKVKVHVRVLLFPMNLVIFSLLGGTSSILTTFLGGTSQKNHPVEKSVKIRSLF